MSEACRVGTVSVQNVKVTFAGYKYCGYYRRGYCELTIEGSGFGCTTQLKDNFHIVDLFNVFDIDCEDPTPLDKLQGKYCRAIFDNSGTLVALQHLIRAAQIWYVKYPEDDFSVEKQLEKVNQ